MAPTPPPRRQPEGDGNALGHFLGARRKLLPPRQAGLAPEGRRPSPGLRRKELAVLAGVSLPYYTRLEQGRDRHPSAQVVAALGRALRLDDEALGYLRQLAGHDADQHRAPAESVRPGLPGLLGQLDGLPAVVFGRYTDVLAANRLAQALHVGYTPGQNVLRFLFRDRRARERYTDWPAVARQAVATLRADCGLHPDDMVLQELVSDLSGHSDEFRELWARHDVDAFTAGQLRYNNPFVGPITLSYEVFAVTGCPGQSIGIAYPVAGSADERSLGMLKTIVADGPFSNGPARRLPAS